jgi:RNA-directed DNA polymerase
VRSLAQQVRSPDTLSRAWHTVLENGRQSRSASTRAAVADFARDADKHLRLLTRQLRDSTFRFSPASGVLATKANGSIRPIVIAPIDSRIVQRAILDVLQRIPAINARLQQRHNFGGIARVGVPDAIKAAYSASKSYRDFVRTDIRDFFVKIPRATAVRAITAHTGQADFDDLLRAATETELENLSSIDRHRELFPLEGLGVAQGCCLSPLLANLLLEEFDQRLNSRGIRCIRYIDDFIIFALSPRNLRGALDSAKNMLAAYGLSCYDPRWDTKAETGKCEGGFEFLGCQVRPGRIRPATKSQKRLMQRIREEFLEALRYAREPQKAIQAKMTYADALVGVQRIVQGWGNTYSFCSDSSLFGSLDVHISQTVASFDRRYRRSALTGGVTDPRDLLGIARLVHCQKDNPFVSGVQADDALISASVRPTVARASTITPSSVAHLL